MEHHYTEILFALYLNNGNGTLEWLTDTLCDHTASGDKEEKEIRHCIGTLVSAGLVNLYLSEHCVHAALTDRGEKAAIGAADVISTQMVKQWQQQTGTLQAAG